MKIVVYETTNGGTAPTLTGTQIRLAKVVTDGTEITSVDTTTSVETSPILGSKLKDATVVEAKIGTGAVTADKIGALAVTAAKINAAAVTTTKVAQAAIGVYHITTKEQSTNMVRNGNFSIASLG